MEPGRWARIVAELGAALGLGPGGGVVLVRGRRGETDEARRVRRRAQTAAAGGA
jgi:hypothetical protein